MASACAAALGLALAPWGPLAEAAPRRVLMIYSFGRDFAPFESMVATFRQGRAGGRRHRQDLPPQLPINTQIGGYYNVVHPDNGAHWQLRVQNAAPVVLQQSRQADIPVGAVYVMPSSARLSKRRARAAANRGKSPLRRRSMAARSNLG